MSKPSMEDMQEYSPCQGQFAKNYAYDWFSVPLLWGRCGVSEMFLPIVQEKLLPSGLLANLVVVYWQMISPLLNGCQLYQQIGPIDKE